MDYSQYTNDELQNMFNMGNFAAGAELASRRQGDPYDFDNLYSEQKLAPNVPAGGDIFTTRFDKYAPSFMNQGVTQLTPEEEYQLYLETEGGNIDREYGERFKPQGIFSRGMDFLNRPSVRSGIGYLFGGLPGAALSFFAPRIGEGITNLFNRTRPAPQIPANTQFGDTDMSRGATTGSGQSVSSSDLSSIGNTGFSEYSDPGTAASYEGSF